LQILGQPCEFYVGQFERRREGADAWEPYAQLIEERRADGLGLRGLHAVAHIKRDARYNSKV
jgi:hypothetical protein